MVTRRVKSVRKDYPIRGYGWHAYTYDGDIDANSAYQFITEQAANFAHMAATDTIEILSSDALDITQTVTVNGIDSSGNKIQEDIALNTTNGTTAVASSSALWRLVNWMELDAVCVGTIQVRRQTGPANLQTITIGQMRSYAAQHLNGEYKSIITNFRASVRDATANVALELRYYPSDTGGTTDPTIAYEVLEEIYIDKAVTSPYNVPNVIPEGGIEVPAGGWIAVFGRTDVANGKANVTLDGYDLTP